MGVGGRDGANLKVDEVVVAKLLAREELQQRAILDGIDGAQLLGDSLLYFAITSPSGTSHPE